MNQVVTFGELMLRLAPPGFERFLQSPQFVATPGGAEANVAAVALCSLGLAAKFVTVLPDKNPIADALIGELRRFGVDVSDIVRGKGRLGTYYMEPGANQRPSRVIYDREYSAISLAASGAIDWDRAMAGAKWFHISGVTPALSASSAALVLESVQKARALGLTVSCDLNYRKNLWKWGKPAKEIMYELVQYTDVLIANEEDVQATLGIESAADVHAGTLDHGHYEKLAEQVLAAFSNLKAIAITLRESHSASHNGWSACLHDRSEFLVSRKYEITHIVDRVGAGDSFAGGLIYGLMQFTSHQQALDLAVAVSCLKHSVLGDFSRISLDDANALVKDGGSGRVMR